MASLLGARTLRTGQNFHVVHCDNSQLQSWHLLASHERHEWTAFGRSCGESVLLRGQNAGYLRFGIANCEHSDSVFPCAIVVKQFDSNNGAHDCPWFVTAQTLQTTLGPSKPPCEVQPLLRRVQERLGVNIAIPLVGCLLWRSYCHRRCKQESRHIERHVPGLLKVNC